MDESDTIAFDDGIELDVELNEFDQAPNTASRLGEAEVARRVGEVSAFFQQLGKALKQIGLYRHNVAGYGEYLRPSFTALTGLLESYESVQLVVEQAGFKYLNQLVYQEEASDLSLAFKFYRDGIRLLRFRRGLTQQELLEFILICLTNFQLPENAYEDMISLMWRKDFEHIEHVVMESFALGSESTEQTHIEVDAIVDHLYHSLATSTTDNLTFARLSLDDLDIEIDDVEQVAGLKVTGQPASPSDQIRFQGELEQDMAQGNLRRLTGLLFTLFEEELDVRLAEALPPAFEQLLDGFLLMENLEAVEWLLDQLAALTQRPIPPGSLALAHHVSKHLAARVCDAERVEHLGEMLEGSAQPELLARVQVYLGRLDERALGPLLAVLEKLSRPEARALICDKLVSFGPEHLDHYTRRLTSNKANYVRDMLAIIDRLAPEGRTKILAGLLSHPNLSLRLQALRAIGDGNDLAGSAYVMKALRDEDAQVRTTAARLMPNFDPGVALRSLLEIAQEPAFADKPDQEQAAVFGALAQLNTDPANEFLKRQLEQSGLLQKKQLAARKRNLVNGLAASGSIGAYRLLAEELKAGVKDKELSDLMMRAATRLKQRLLGESGGGQPKG